MANLYLSDVHLTDITGVTDVKKNNDRKCDSIILHFKLNMQRYLQSSSSAIFSEGGSSVGRPAIWTSSLMTSSVVILLSMAKKASSRALKQQENEISVRKLNAAFKTGSRHNFTFCNFLSL